MYDGIEYRGNRQADVEELAAHAGVPVYNGLTDEWHPTQMLADFLTMYESSHKRPSREPPLYHQSHTCGNTGEVTSWCSYPDDTTYLPSVLRLSSFRSPAGTGCAAKLYWHTTVSD